MKNEEQNLNEAQTGNSIKPDGSSSKKQTYYDANGNEITNAWMVDSDGNPMPFESTNAAKNGYKSALEYVAAYKK